MNLYTTYSKEDLNKVSAKDLEIVKGYSNNLNNHLNNIKQRILIDDNTLISIIAAINAGFNIILYGPPGTAKSTLSQFLPVEFYGAKCNMHTADSEWNVRKVIGGLTVSYDTSAGEPKEKITPKEGYLVEDIMECYESNLCAKEHNTVFTIIDEFNRTNMDECLGPMFTAIGSDNKTLKLDFNKGFNDHLLEIQIPKQYRIICNMNKYDRTFTNELSDALSRRFKWIYIGAPNEDQYTAENAIARNNVFGSVSTIEPEMPSTFESIVPYEDSNFFKETIESPMLAVIDELRKDLEIGTSYKIDSIKLAYHFMRLKLNLINWDEYDGVNETELLNANNLDTLKEKLTDPAKQDPFEKVINTLIEETIDAALVMTVIPACESLEEEDAIKRIKNLFDKYIRCTKELGRMKLIF